MSLFKNMTFEERVARYDADASMHYYVYFSSASYKYSVDVIQFDSLDNVKSEYYRSLTYYDTYAEAKDIANMMNENDDNISHLINREIIRFNDELVAISKVHANKLSNVDNRAINLLRDTADVVKQILEAKEET